MSQPGYRDDADANDKAFCGAVAVVVVVVVLVPVFPVVPPVVCVPPVVWVDPPPTVRGSAPVSPHASVSTSDPIMCSLDSVQACERNASTHCADGFGAYFDDFASVVARPMTLSRADTALSAAASDFSAAVSILSSDQESVLKTLERTVSVHVMFAPVERLFIVTFAAFDGVTMLDAQTKTLARTVVRPSVEERLDRFMVKSTVYKTCYREW